MADTPKNNRQKVIDLLSTVKVNKKAVPFAYAQYDGDAKTYIVWLQTDLGNTMSADDKFQDCAEYFDITVYSNKDYIDIVDTIISTFDIDQVTFQPSRCSEDLYDADTRMYHKTLCFAFYKHF